MNPVELVENALKAIPELAAGNRVFAVDAPSSGVELPCVIYTYTGDTLTGKIGRVSERRRTLAFEIDAIHETAPKAFQLGDSILRALDNTGKTNGAGYTGPFLSVEQLKIRRGPATSVVYVSRSTFEVFY